MKARQNLQLVAGVLAATSGMCVIGGDFNCTPQELESTGWLKKVGGVIVAPSSPTNGVRAIDFCVVSAALRHMSRGAKVVADIAGFPHRPVRLFMDALARPIWTRSLMSPATFGARLAFGPPVKPADAPHALQPDGE